MGFFEAVVRALIYLCFIFLAFLLCIWVFGMLGIALPGQVVMVLKVIFILIAILIMARLFYPIVSTYQWFGPRPPNP